MESHNRVVCVFLSPADYHRHRRTVRQIHRAGELPPEIRTAIDEAVYPTDEEFAVSGL